MGSVASSASGIRFCQEILWLESLDEDEFMSVLTCCGTPLGASNGNRIVHVLKARNTRGRGQKVGYRFDSGTLTYDEVGSSQRANAADTGRRWGRGDCRVIDAATDEAGEQGRATELRISQLYWNFLLPMSRQAPTINRVVLGWKPLS
ncbi:MAG TPA: hypothetical protein VLI39_09135 [Sedimentisphaerales bacterium]|nr:hypothetical protein [Sedimentisphaerales bacterium]